MHYCPHHPKSVLLPEGPNVLYCPDPRCTHATTRAALGQQKPEPRQKGVAAFCGKKPKVKVLEADLQAEVVQRLQGLGYEVMETGRARSLVTCDKCGAKNYAAGWQGNTPSLPDLQIRKASWPRGVWLDIELKGSETRVTQGQQDLYDRGGSYICRTYESAEEALEILNQYLQKGDR